MWQTWECSKFGNSSLKLVKWWIWWLSMSCHPELDSEYVSASSHDKVCASFCLQLTCWSHLPKWTNFYWCAQFHLEFLSCAQTHSVTQTLQDLPSSTSNMFWNHSRVSWTTFQCKLWRWYVTWMNAHEYSSLCTLNALLQSSSIWWLDQMSKLIVSSSLEPWCHSWDHLSFINFRYPELVSR